MADTKTATADPRYPTAELTVGTGTYTVPIEPIAPGLAITAAFVFVGDPGDDSKPQLGGGFLITHLPTSRTIPDNQACIACCRAAGRILASMELDWSAVDGEQAKTLVASLEGDEKQRLMRAVHTMRACRQRACSHDEGV